MHKCRLNAGATCVPLQKQKQKRFATPYLANGSKLCIGHILQVEKGGQKLDPLGTV